MYALSALSAAELGSGKAAQRPGAERRLRRRRWGWGGGADDEGDGTSTLPMNCFMPLQLTLPLRPVRRSVKCEPRPCD